MKLYTKNNCSACEDVKAVIKGLQRDDVEIVNVTNDMVKIMQLKDRLEEIGNPKTFPILETDLGILINPSAEIVMFLKDPVKQ